VCAPICRDVLIETQRRDPGRKVPQPEAVAQTVPAPAIPPPPPLARASRG
jgi:hypothetical protein